MEILFWRIDAVLGSVYLISHVNEQPKKLFYFYYNGCLVNSCLEATGIYGLALAKHLYQTNQKVIVANPLQTHAFAKMEMARN
ncbi:MAG: transposase, partial [Paraglaciecola sp.]